MYTDKVSGANMANEARYGPYPPYPPPQTTESANYAQLTISIRNLGSVKLHSCGRCDAYII